MRVVSFKRVTIKKPRHCWGCTEVYNPPTKMNRVTCSDNGKIYNVYWCDSCQGILDKNPFSDEEYCYGELSGNL